MSVTLHTTLGDVKLEVCCGEVPRIAYNFLALAASGAYDGTKFLRNIAGFLIQGGDPTGTGKGGESVWGGYLKDQVSPALAHDARGVVAMAPSKADRVGSQFFILYGPQPHLADAKGSKSIFARVIHGWETLDAMEKAPVSGKKYRPVEPIVLKNVTIHANPFAELPVNEPPDTVRPAR